MTRLQFLQQLIKQKTPIRLNVSMMSSHALIIDAYRVSISKEIGFKKARLKVTRPKEGRHYIFDFSRIVDLQAVSIDTSSGNLK